MLTVKLVYKLKNISDDLKWTTNTHVTLFTLTSKATDNIYGFETLFCSFIFYPSTHISTCPQWFLPVQMMGGRSLHKAMPRSQWMNTSTDSATITLTHLDVGNLINSVLQCLI